MSFESTMRLFDGGSLRAREQDDLENYYEAKARLSALGISIPPRARVLEIQAGFAKLAVDVLTEVLIPTGFIFGGGGRSEDLGLLRRTWQRNDMDSQFTLAATEALVTGGAFWVLSPPDEERDYVTVRALDVRHAGARLDYLGRVTEAVAVYRLPSGDRGATYYTRDGIDLYVQDGGRWLKSAHRDDPWGTSIVPMFNRARTKDRYGRSDIRELRPLIDAASRTLTNLQIAQELAALPLRFLIGDGAAQMLEEEPDRFAMYMSNLLGVPEGGDVKQLSGASMDPFLNTYKLYALQVSAMTGIPPSMMGVAADSNPTSAEALRVAKDRLIARAERKQVQFADALERVGRLILQMEDRPLDGLETLEVTWRDAATASASAQMATALQAAAQGVLSPETAREFLGLSPEQLARENASSADIRAMSGLAQVAQDAATARRLQQETTPTAAGKPLEES